MKSSNKAKRPTDIIKILLYVAAIVVVAVVMYIYSEYRQEQSQYPDLTQAAHTLESLPGVISGPRFYAGEELTDAEAAQYFTKHKAVPGLMDALRGYEEEKPCSGLQGRHKQYVLGVTEDQTQGLIGNGCGGTGIVRSFLVKQGDTWTRVGAFNGADSHFSELLDIPSCAVVDEYVIQKSIAPICFEAKEGRAALYAGDLTNYSYKIR